MWGHEWGTMIWGGAAVVPTLTPIGALLLVALIVGATVRYRRRPPGPGRARALALFVVLVAIPVLAVAAPITLPHVFTNGTIADADEVNANFDELVLESDAQDTRLTALETSQITEVAAGTGLTGGGTAGSLNLDVDPGYVQRRVAGTCPVGQSIRAIDSAGLVTCEVDSVGTGDITGVTAGTGLTGGGTSGSVSLAVANAGIGATQIANGAVRTGEIFNGTIVDIDVSGAAAIAPAKIAGTAATLSYTTQDFGGVLYLDNGSNEVGINDTTPSSALDVNGTIRATEFQLRSAASYSHYLHPSEFHTSAASWVSTGSILGYRYTSDTNGLLVLAPLHLPQGANLTAVYCYYSDDDATLELQSFDFTLYAVQVGGVVATAPALLIADPANFNDATVRSVSDTSVSGTGDPVDNHTYRYSLEVNWDLANGPGPGFSDVRFHGCRIAYSLATLATP